jgi:hypothetical protein
MKKYHLTILRNDIYETIFGEMSSIASFLLIEKELGNKTYVLYSRELSKDEWTLVEQQKEYYDKQFRRN